MDQQELRNRVRLLKAIEATTFKEIAENLLEMKTGSFYNFMSNRAKLSIEKSKKLNDYINNILD